MFCTVCGKEVKGHNKFCTYCGAPAEPLLEILGTRCPNCGAEYDTEQIFCPVCGWKLLLRIRDRQVTIPLIGQSAGHRPLWTMGMLSCYHGLPKSHPVSGRGRVLLYPDALEFEKNITSTTASLLGAVGMTDAQKKAEQNSQTDIYPLSAVTGVRRDKYLAMPVLILTFKDGSTVSFCGPASGSEMDRAAELILQYRSL